MGITMLSQTQRYAAGGLFAIALRQAQIHQSQPLGSPRSSEAGHSDSDDDCRKEEDSILDDSQLWIHPSRGLLRPILRFLGINSSAWRGLEETAVSSPAKHHIGAFLRILVEESKETTSESIDQELALTNAVDAMVSSLEVSPVSPETAREKLCEYKLKCLGKTPTSKTDSVPEAADALPETPNTTNSKMSSSKTTSVPEVADALPENLNPLNLKSMPDNTRALNKPVKRSYGDFVPEGTMVNYQRKVAVLFELLSACVADTVVEEQKQSELRKGYDARHRVALRLLATWLDMKWIQMEAMEVMVACSVMAKVKEEAEHGRQSRSPDGKWSKWKRGGIIGAAALTGGALMAITGGLAAPAIAAGFSALAPTLGTLVPVIGASGFAAAASAAGTVAGSVAVAASFGAAGAGLTGSKMARRIGDIDEFEFIPIGEHHNQGRLAVGILVSGFVFEEEDFLRPWEGRDDYLERYALQWESKNLIAVSSAIQDWITSRVTMELMKQGAMVTVLSTLLTALAWPATLLAATDFIDSTWTIAVDRSDKAGKLLAEVLLNGLQGGRPVTLLGFSLGARVIFKCLQHLAESGDNEGIIERVVLLGAPISLTDENWENARKMVAGRFVNVYSANDWTLGLAFRANLLTKGLAGIQPVNLPGIENVDVTDFIEGHSSYLWATEEILGQLELDTYYPVFSSSPKKAE